MSRRKQALKSQVGSFLKEYSRTARRRGCDPNDRHYDRDLEKQIKKLSPEEFDELMRDGGELPLPASERKKTDPT